MMNIYHCVHTNILMKLPNHYSICGKKGTINALLDLGRMHAARLVAHNAISPAPAVSVMDQGDANRGVNDPIRVVDDSLLLSVLSANAEDIRAARSRGPLAYDHNNNNYTDAAWEAAFRVSSSSRDNSGNISNLSPSKPNAAASNKGPVANLILFSLRCEIKFGDYEYLRKQCLFLRQLHVFRITSRTAGDFINNTTDINSVSHVSDISQALDGEKQIAPLASILHFLHEGAILSFTTNCIRHGSDSVDMSDASEITMANASYFVAQLDNERRATYVAAAEQDLADMKRLKRKNDQALERQARKDKKEQELLEEKKKREKLSENASSARKPIPKYKDTKETFKSIDRSNKRKQGKTPSDTFISEREMSFIPALGHMPSSDAATTAGTRATAAANGDTVDPGSSDADDLFAAVGCMYSLRLGRHYNNRELIRRTLKSHVSASTKCIPNKFLASAEPEIKHTQHHLWQLDYIDRLTLVIEGSRGITSAVMFLFDRTIANEEDRNGISNSSRNTITNNDDTGAKINDGSVLDLDVQPLEEVLTFGRTAPSALTPKAVLLTESVRALLAIRTFAADGQWSDVRTCIEAYHRSNDIFAQHYKRSLESHPTASHSSASPGFYANSNSTVSNSKGIDQGNEKKSKTSKANEEDALDESSVFSSLHPKVVTEIYTARQAGYVLPALVKCRAAYMCASRLRGTPGNCIIGASRNVSNPADVEMGSYEEWELHAMKEEKEEQISNSDCLNACTEALESLALIDENWKTRNIKRHEYTLRSLIYVRKHAMEGDWFKVRDHARFLLSVDSWFDKDSGDKHSPVADSIDVVEEWERRVISDNKTTRRLSILASSIPTEDKKTDHASHVASILQISDSSSLQDIDTGKYLIFGGLHMYVFVIHSMIDRSLEYRDGALLYPCIHEYHDHCNHHTHIDHYIFSMITAAEIMRMSSAEIREELSCLSRPRLATGGSIEQQVSVESILSPPALAMKELALAFEHASYEVCKRVRTIYSTDGVVHA